MLHEIIQELVNLKAARASTEWQLWEKAIRDAIEALRANDTFDLVDPPPGAHIIGSTVVFRVKLSAHGGVERLKARICAQGFTQQFLKDYCETYAPVAKLTSIPVFLAMVTQMGMRVRQGDVPTAYVKAGPTEVLDVRQPPEFEKGSRTKDLGNVQWFLGIRITMDTTRGITTMDQTQYASEVLRRFEMDECRPQKTPLDKGAILYNRAEADDAADQVTYRQAVGALLYLARVTRPDIAFAVNQGAAHALNPSQGHWIAVKNILRYVEGTKEWSLVYRRNATAPPDADWANNEQHRKSISSVLVQVFGCSVSWQTKRQRIVSESSTIAEYIAADDGVEEAHWVHLLL
ncbi:unnamed protein product [Phytophthora fragariaefolia]|uniref:Unnamed protein product n=1 Tax=Phytophthora fragariaefolia TaxID=1490495 RepID=A0A9W6XET4_9STRA|nr:unnamed protein product [Phytophthora fragariaefolia]